MGGQRSQAGVGGLGWLAPGAAVRYAAVEKDAVIVAAGNKGEQSECGQNPAFNPLNPGDPRDWAGVRTIVTPAWFSDYVLAVGAVTPAGQPLPDSINGPWVSVAAPGWRIMGLSNVNGAAANALPDRDPGMGDGFWGISFAAAYTSEVAALVGAKFPNLTAPPSKPRRTKGDADNWLYYAGQTWLRDVGAPTMGRHATTQWTRRQFLVSRNPVTAIARVLNP